MDDPITRLPGYMANAPAVIQAADQGVTVLGWVSLAIIGLWIVHVIRTRRDP